MVPNIPNQNTFSILPIRKEKRKSPKGIKASSSHYASFEDASTSGTAVLRSQHDDSDSPQTPRSRLGLNRRNLNASLEDSATNLLAAIQGGLRKVSPPERFALGKLNNDVQKSRRDHMSSSSDSSRSSREYIDAQKGVTRSDDASDDEESAKIISSFVPLSAIADDPKGPIVQIFINALVNMERKKPRSCDALVTKLLQQLASSKESSLNEMQELAAQLFSKTKSDEETRNADSDNKKKQNKEVHSNRNLSPLARFLLSRQPTSLMSECTHSKQLVVIIPTLNAKSASDLFILSLTVFIAMISTINLELLQFSKAFNIKTLKVFISLIHLLKDTTFTTNPNNTLAFLLCGINF
ncbi:hypothetical protein CR513_41516, partial [Mucuna pruriens]